MTIKRRRFKQTQSLQERLPDDAMRVRAQAKELPPCAKKKALLERARQDESAIRLADG